jgi:hypothetical protein
VRTAFGGAVLFTLIVAFFSIEKARGRSAWKSYQEEARSRQTKLNLTEFVQPAVPDERNFAAIPLFQEAFADPAAGKVLELPHANRAKLPSLGNIAKDQLPDLAGWQKFFVDAKFIPAAGDDAAADVLKALEHYAPQWEQLRAAAGRPESRFPVRYEDGAAAALPHVQLFQSAPRIIALKLAAHLAQGNSAAAYEDFRLGLRLYAALEKEPTLIAGLVRIGGLSILENGVWAGLVQRQWAAPELEKMESGLAQLRLFDDCTLAMGSERGFNNLIYDQYARKGAADLAELLVVVQDGQPRPSTRLATMLLAPYPSGWWRLSQTRTNRYFDEILGQISQDPPRVYLDRPVTSMPASMAGVGLVERARYFLFFTMTPALSDIGRSYAYAQTLLDETRLACALERHRLANGNYPASLDPLAPAFLPVLPRDVMNGEPLHYRLGDDGGYVLYSVGWNLRDDGGKSEPDRSAKRQDDWVWKMRGR